MTVADMKVWQTTSCMSSRGTADGGWRLSATVNH